MKISDLLKHKGNEVFTIHKDATAQEILRKLNEKHVGALIVVNDEGGMEGLVSERDLLWDLETCLNCKGTKARELMTKMHNVIIAHPTDDTEYAMKMFTKNKIRHLPILEGEKLVGIISIGDVIHSLLDNVEMENKLLKDYMSGSYPILS